MDRHVGAASWRYLTADNVGAAAGLALDEALMRGVGRTVESPVPTLRLYTYANAALVGRYQTLDAELDLATCAAVGAEVSRRPTGGGAIVMGPGQLGVGLVVPTPGSAPQDTMLALSRGIIEGLRFLGVHAEFGGKNDLLAGGRKIAGLGLYLDPDGALLFHASILRDLDVEFMLRVLRIPAAKLAGKAVAAVADRVTTVNRELNRTIDPDTLREAVAAGFAQRHGVRLNEAEPSADERAAAARLVAERYAHPSWLERTNAQPDGTGSAAMRAPQGLVRVFVAAQGALIKSVMFTGDFNAVPAGLLQLESALRWRRLDERSVADVVAHVRAQVGPDPGWGADSDVVAAVLGAGARAVQRHAAAPVRPTGSCYFPDAEPALAGAAAGPDDHRSST